ncbi:YgfZ/GcvT domain-containing protein [Solilutibacter silvestris]|uniref:Folate-binding protein YgfZ n=1 Tax=Solilutibacter silvestris TaxID=1645665 RepID=A0A2K1PYC5_9GAMM|nr:folate-binding protein YgfZ [Lysobacter silvestris]PNS07794.1 folate-binding protein YgfZ [Lysobacter silvestris]
MPDNPNPSAFALTGQSVLEISGPDAIAFMQAQCMNDVAQPGDGQWQWNGWLTPQGRVIALFALLRRDAQTLWCVLPDMPASALAQQLQRFVFRSKVKLIARDDLHVGGSFASPPSAQGATAALGEDAASLDLSAQGGERTWLIGATQFDADDEAAQRWRTMDLRHGLPRFRADAEPKWTSQQLSLDRLQAYSVKKGCYPGQEIVARTHFLGQAKRGLLLLEGIAAVEAGTAISDGSREIGSIISTSEDVALAVATLDPSAIEVDGRAAKISPLLDGLAR